MQKDKVDKVRLMQLPGAAEGRIDIKEMRHLLPLPAPTIDNVLASKAEEDAQNL